MLRTFQKYSTILLFIVAWFISGTALAQYEIPPKPSKETSVYDYINLLTPSQKSSLENKLVRYADSTSTQIVCLIIGSTKGEDISMLGAEWGQKWGIGQKGEDNGIVILLAKDDRKVDINTGYGIEYRITDLMSERIINRIMIPEFKNENYYAGLDKGSDAIFAALKGEFKEDRDFGKKDGGHIPFFIIFIFIIILLSLFRKGGKGGRGGRGGGLLDILILSSLGRTGGFGGGGGGFGGGGGGGGFGGGFGGGGFGGGGASGGW
ncbi:TPM domain-containing protein [Aequorivita sp. H23M31]|uniref:TPM domain-containing protein n=1 Tax=Aequorivita ciconiae TaxID=2494375 RepID=A0A410G6F1_9FLAO|nr:TPM domain-containing protein [Aequorivita sp. H23M31]QAA82820.1 TPM domain-containing protein [Aequorivita sp. H23M31]